MPAPILALLPAAGRPTPDDGLRAAGGGTRVTGRGVGVVVLPIPIAIPPPVSGRLRGGVNACRLRWGGSLRGPSLTLGAAFGMT